MRPRVLVALLVATAAVGYICRVAITIVAPGIMAEFHLTQAQMGTVFSAFLVGYTVCQIPSGWLSDRINARRLFLTIAILWALLTAATAGVGWRGLLAGLPALLIVRALFGVAAAPMYPASARTIAVTIKREAQGAANGAVLSSIGIGSAVAPLMLGAFIARWGWRPALLVPAGMAAVIALLWGVAEAGMARVSDPYSPAVETASRRSETRATPFRRPAYWFLCASYFLQGYIGYIFVFWFYLYLVQVRHFAVLQAAALTALPWICTLIAIPAGGALSDYAVHRWGATRGRRSLPAAALIIGAVFLVAGARTSNAYLAVACLTACTVLVLCTEGPFWATMNQLCGTHSGAGGGVMNFGSNLGGMISPALTPWLAERIGWSAALSFTAALAVVAGLLWFGVAIQIQAHSADAAPAAS